MNSLFRRCIPYLCAGLISIPVFYCIFFRNKPTLIGISDSCFLCGILLVLFSLVCFISQSGLFDRAIYSFYTFRRIFRRKETKALPFEEYIQKHKGLKSNWLPAACGAAYIILAALAGAIV